MLNFRDFHFWRRSRDLSIRIYQITESFPKTEQFGLTNQIRRCSVSIPSNIAEGASRSSKKDFSRFLEIAIGSAHELETQIDIANQVQYISNKDYQELNKEVVAIIKLISKYKSHLKSNR